MKKTDFTWMFFIDLHNFLVIDRNGIKIIYGLKKNRCNDILIKKIKCPSWKQSYYSFFGKKIPHGS